MDACRNAYTDQKPEAFRLCDPLAQKGNRDAQKMLGDMYYWGWGDQVTQDYGTAVLWYKRAGIKGQNEARYDLGVMFEQGVGVAVDYSRAAKWYMDAAKGGHAMAQFNVANMYAKGAGTHKNDTQAAKWYLRAAEQGLPEAQYNIGNRYAKGLGVEQNAIEAYKWYLLAEKAGDADAQRNIIIIENHMTGAATQQAKQLAEQWKAKKE